LELARDAIYLPYVAAVEVERRTLLADFGVEGVAAPRSVAEPLLFWFDPATAPPL
jgi:hypothetical protein